ncbi:Hypothetical predicted protein, partial [Paramuricea clavata]
MSEKEHKQELTTLKDDIMSEIDLKPLHPKNKLLLYSRYLLSKLSWHFTVTTLSKTWVSENMDSVVNKYVRKWLEIPISGTLSNVYLTSNKFGLNIYPPSIKFVQCQTVARNALKTSPNHSIKDLWKTTTESKNIQYDVYTSTKEVLKTFTSGQEDKLQNHLILQGSFFSKYKRNHDLNNTIVWLENKLKSTEASNESLSETIMRINSVKLLKSKQCGILPFLNRTKECDQINNDRIEVESPVHDNTKDVCLKPNDNKPEDSNEENERVSQPMAANIQASHE